VAGVVVDRVDRKSLLLVADGARAIAFVSLVAALALDRIVLAHILAVAFVEGAFFVFFRLAESAALPQVVPKEQLPAAVAQSQARDQGAELAGAPPGRSSLRLRPAAVPLRRCHVRDLLRHAAVRPLLPSRGACPRGS
jgi:hypothetical protein